MTPNIPGFLYGFIKGFYAEDDIDDLIDDITDVYSPYYRWISPIEEYDFHIPNWRMDNAETKGPYWWRCLLTGDFYHNYNVSVGYSLRWRSFDLPIGIRIGLSYEWRGLCVEDGMLRGLHRTSGLVPSVGVNWRVLGLDFEREHNWNLLLECGTSYVKVLTYNDPCGLGSEAANSGYRGAVSLGVILDTWQYSLRYEWDCYDYLNVPGYGTHLQNLVLMVGIVL